MSKILLLTREYPPNSVGGLAITSESIALGLQVRNHTVFVISSGDKVCKRNGITIFGNDCCYPYETNGNNIKISKKIFNIAKNIINEKGIDKIIVPDIFCYNEAHILSEIYNIPMIFVCLQSFYTQRIDNSKYLFVSKYAKESYENLVNYEEKVMKRATRIVFISQSLCDEMRKKYLILGKYCVIPLGIDLCLIDSMSQHTNILNHNFINLTVNARLVPIKGVYELVQSFKMISLEQKKIRLNIIGDGPEYDKIKQFCIKNRMQEQVKLFGKLEHKNALQIMKESDYGVIPSLWESFCYVAIEFMALKIPLLAAYDTALKEVCPLNIDYHFSLQNGKINPARLAASIKSMLKDTHGKNKKISNARKYVEDNFTQDLFIKKLSEFMENSQ